MRERKRERERERARERGREGEREKEGERAREREREPRERERERRDRETRERERERDERERERERKTLLATNSQQTSTSMALALKALKSTLPAAPRNNKFGSCLGSTIRYIGGLRCGDQLQRESNLDSCCLISPRCQKRRPDLSLNHTTSFAPLHPQYLVQNEPTMLLWL